MASNPMVFFDNTDLADSSTSAPKVVGKVQWASSDRTRVVERVAKSDAGLVRTFP